MIHSKKRGGEITAAPADRLAASIFPFVSVPWAGTSEFMQLKKLSAPELNSCGDFNMFGAGESSPKKKNIPPEKALADMIAMREIQDNIAKLTMISPSYDEVVEHINKMNPTRVLGIESIKKSAELLKEFANPNEKECKALMSEISALKAKYMFPLPEDTYGFLSSWATGADGMALDVYSKEMMVSHAVLAEKGKCRPCDIAGFDEEKEFLRQNYDTCAWSALHEARVLMGAVKNPKR